MPVTINHLEDLTLLVRSARQTHLYAQHEFVIAFRTFFDCLRRQMHYFGDDGFAQIVTGLDVGENSVDAFNALINSFNRAQLPDPDGLTDADASGVSVPTTPKSMDTAVEQDEPEDAEEVEPVKAPTKKPSSSPKKPRSQGGA